MPFDLPTLARPTGTETRTLKAAVRTKGMRKKPKKQKIPKTAGTPNDPHPPRGVTLLQHRTLQAMTGQRWPYGSYASAPDLTPTMASVFGKAPRPQVTPITTNLAYADRGGPATPIRMANVPEDNATSASGISTSGFGGYEGSGPAPPTPASPAAKTYFGHGQASDAAAIARLQSMFPEGKKGGILDPLGGPMSSAYTWSGRGASAVSYGLSALGNTATGDFDQAFKDVKDTGKSAARFAEPFIKYNPINPASWAMVGTEIATGNNLDISPGTDPEILWLSDTLAGKKITEQVERVPYVGKPAAFATSMALDIAGDPLSWVGVSAAGTAARQGARRTIGKQIAEKWDKSLRHGNPLEVVQKDYMLAAGKSVQAADAVEPHFTFNVRVPFSRTPVPGIKRATNDVPNVPGLAAKKETLRSRFYNVNKGSLKQTGYKPRMRNAAGELVDIDTAGFGERGLGIAHTFKAPAGLRHATKYTKALTHIAHVDKEIDRQRAAARAFSPPHLQRTSTSEKFGHWLQQEREKIAAKKNRATGKAQHVIKSIDDLMGATATRQIKAIDSTSRLTSSAGGHARDIEAAWSMATKQMNAATAYATNNYLQPILKILKKERIDEHYFARLVDDPTNPEFSIRGYAHDHAKGNPERADRIAEAIERAYNLHQELDKRMMAFAKNNDMLPDGAWTDYFPRYGKSADMNDFLQRVDRYEGPQRAAIGPTRRGWEYARIHARLSDVEKKFEEDVASQVDMSMSWEKKPTARDTKNPWKSNVVDTEYGVAMSRHIGDMAFSVADRNLYAALAELRGGVKRIPRDIQERIDALIEERDALRAEIRHDISRDKEEIASAKVGVKDTKAQAKESAAELRGAERAYHEAPSKRQTKINSLRNSLEQLAKSALKRTEEGYDPASNSGVEVKHTRLRAEAEKKAKELGELAGAASTPEQVSDIAQAAMRAVTAADQGKVALTSEIVALVDRRMSDMIESVRDLRTQGATLGAPTQAVTGPGAHKVYAKGKWKRDFPLEQLPSRIQAYRALGIEFPMTRQRAGMRSARNLRTQAAERAARQRGEWTTSPDGMRHDPKPTKAQEKSWATTFEGRTPDRIAEANERFEVGVEEARRRASDELGAAQRGMQEALRGRNQSAIIAARGRLREADRAMQKELMRLGAAKAGYIGTPRGVAAKQKKLDRIEGQLQKAQRQQARWDKHRRSMPIRPMQEVDQDEFQKQIEMLRENGNTIDKYIADKAESTGYLMPADAAKGHAEWTDRIQYSQQTPAELKGITKRAAQLQVAWKRYTLGSTRRLLRDSLEDTLLLAVEGVRNPALIGHTLHLLSMPLHESKVESKGVQALRSFSGKVAPLLGGGGKSAGITLRDGSFVPYRVLRREMELFGVTDMGQSHEALRTGTVTVRGEREALGVRPGMGEMLHTRQAWRTPSYGRAVTGLLAANQVRDNFPRMALYMHRRMEGDDMLSAARHVDKIFFDYANLNKQLMRMRRSIAPFVTFLAKSLPMLARLSYEHPSFFSFEAKLASNLQQASGQDPLSLLIQRSPTSPDVFNIPMMDKIAEWLGAKPDPQTGKLEGVLWDPQSATRMSALNLIPYSRGGSNPLESFALSAGMLAGGPIVDALGGVYNFDTRRGEAYGEWRNTDPLTFNLLRGISAGKLAKIDQDPTDPQALRYRVRSPALSFLRAVDPYIPGTLGAFSYTAADALTGSGWVKPVTGADEMVGDKGFAGLQLIRDPSQRARGHQRLWGELSGLSLRPESKQTAMHYFQQRNK